MGEKLLQRAEVSGFGGGEFKSGRAMYQQQDMALGQFNEKFPSREGKSKLGQ